MNEQYEHIPISIRFIWSHILHMLHLWTHKYEQQNCFNCVHGKRNKLWQQDSLLFDIVLLPFRSSRSFCSGPFNQLTCEKIFALVRVVRLNEHHSIAAHVDDEQAHTYNTRRIFSTILRYFYSVTEKYKRTWMRYNKRIWTALEGEVAYTIYIRWPMKFHAEILSIGLLDVEHWILQSYTRHCRLHHIWCTPATKEID